MTIIGYVLNKNDINFKIITYLNTMFANSFDTKRYINFQIFPKSNVSHNTIGKRKILYN